MSFQWLLLLAPALLSVSGAEVGMPTSAVPVALGFRLESLLTQGSPSGRWSRLAVVSGREFLLLVRTNAAIESGHILRVVRPTLDHPFQLNPVEVPVREVTDLALGADAFWLVGLGAEGRGLYRLVDAEGDGQFEHCARVPLPTAGVPDGLFVGPGGNLFVLLHEEGNWGNGAPPGQRTVGRYARFPCLRDQLEVLGPRARNHAVLWRGDPTGQRWQRFAGGLKLPARLMGTLDGELWAVCAGLEGIESQELTQVVSGADLSVNLGEPDLPADRWAPPGARVPIRFRVEAGAGGSVVGKWGATLVFVGAGRDELLAVKLDPKEAGQVATVADVADREVRTWNDLRAASDGVFYGLASPADGSTELVRLDWKGVTNLAAPREMNASLQLRRQLETLHFQPDASRLDFIWANLANRDPFLRFAARVALERIEPEVWRDRALSERRPSLAFAALAALVRVKGASSGEVLTRAWQFLPESLDQSQTLDWLQVFELAFVALGRPEAAVQDRVLARLESIYPFDDLAVDRELCRQLSWLGSAQVIAKTRLQMDTLSRAEDQLELLGSLNVTESPLPTSARRQLAEWVKTKAATSDVLSERWSRLAELLAVPSEVPAGTHP